VSPVYLNLYDKRTQVTNLNITSTSNEPLDQLTAVQLVKKFSALYEIGKFIIISRRLSHRLAESSLRP